MNETKKRGWPVFLLSFLMPVLALILIFIVKGIYPFGDNSFLRTDMYHQYAPFFAEFGEKLQLYHLAGLLSVKPLQPGPVLFIKACGH